MALGGLAGNMSGGRPGGQTFGQDWPTSNQQQAGWTEQSQHVNISQMHDGRNLRAAPEPAKAAPEPAKAELASAEPAIRPTTLV